jgi:hypothetical protein
MRRPRAAERGQATVELVAVLPLVLAAAFAGASVLAAQAAQERAGDAARAGAMELLQGGDPEHAARELLRPGEREGVRVQGSRVTVVVRPRLPLHLSLPQLTARATADAGPEPRP